MTTTPNRECCDHCMWLGPINRDGTMRKHFRAERVGRYGRRVQHAPLGVCPGSHRPPATIGAIATETPAQSYPDPATGRATRHQRNHMSTCVSCEGYLDERNQGYMSGHCDD